MKKILMSLLLLSATQLINAQTKAVSGSVKDDKGNPLRYVFILDAQYKDAALSDSLGNYSIKVRPESKLQFALPGYKDETANAGKGNEGPQVVLNALNANASNNSSGGLTAKVTNQEDKIDVSTMRTGGQIAPGHQKGNLVGSQYLFEVFVHGFITDASGEVIYNSDHMLDYDKIRGGLLAVNDGKTVELMDWDKVNGFTLYSPTDVRYDFEKNMDIDKSHFLQVLTSGPKYKIYKLIKTKFVRSDYVNNGAAPHGHDYDEFVDDADYFFLDVQDKQPKKLSLEKKSIKENFAKEADKVNKYLSDHSGSIDDAYLSKLGDYMNQ